MSSEWRETFRAALQRVNVADFARATGRPYRTVQDWKLGNRNPPVEALAELVDYLRSQAQAYAAAAADLRAAAPPETEGGHDG